MIPGIVTQDESIPRLVTLFPQSVAGDDSFGQAAVLGDADVLIVQQAVGAPDVIHPPVIGVGMSPQVVVDADVVFGPTVQSLRQNLFPGLYVATDVINPPDIRFPGKLQPQAVWVEADVIYGPVVLTPGSLTASLWADIEAVFGPTVTRPDSLFPGFVNDSVAEVFYAPAVKVVASVSFVVDVDTVYGSAINLYLAPHLVTDVDDVSSYGHQIGFLATLDGAASNTTVSVDKLTATHSVAVGASGVRSTSLRVSGKYYFEATIGATHGGADAVGVLAMNGVFADSSAGQNVTADYSSTSIYSAGSSWADLGAWSAGDRIDVAIDLDGRQAWFRRNGGSWNTVTSANPATGVGSIPVAADVPFAPYVGFGGSPVGNIGDNVTLNFGQHAFGGTRPSGFALWPAVAEVLALYPSVVSDVDVFYVPSITGLALVPDRALDPETFYPANVTREALIGTYTLSSSRAGIGSVVVRPTASKTQVIPNIGAITL